MQALSLVVHIPLVCFGIAFPSLVLFAEWRFLRTGDPLFRTLARRWSKVMLALFAVGVVTGTILSLELGLLWPGFMAAFGNVFGLGFVLEGISFFRRALFTALFGCGGGGAPPPPPLPVRFPGGGRGGRRIAVRHLRQRLDESAHGIRARRRRRHRRPAMVGALREPVLLARVRAHVLRGVRRRRLPARQRLCVEVPPRVPGSLRAGCSHHCALRRRRRRSRADRHRGLGGA